MVYITGDCHADFHRFSVKNFPEQKEMTRDDYVIICGDFGGIWTKDKSSNQEKWWLDWFGIKPFTVVFVDGNHENFDRLLSDEFEIVDYCGGKAHKIRDNVYHLIRGYVFEFCGKKFWAFGGASSHDIRHGILDRERFRTDEEFLKTVKKWKRENREFRINHLSWWEQELPTQREMNFGCEQLDANGNEVDYIITHCAPQQIAAFLSNGGYVPDALTSFFNVISESVRFRGWFFGHYHTEARIMGAYFAIYRSIIRIE